MLSRLHVLCALFVFLGIAVASPAITFQTPPLVVAGTTFQDEQVFAERYGVNRGRLHIVYRALNTSGGNGIWYTHETGVGNNVFTSPILVSALDNKTYTEPDIAVDRNSTAHIVFIGKNPTVPANDSVFYCKVSSGGSLTTAAKITPDTVTVAFSPQVAAVQFSGRSQVQPHVSYICNDLNGGFDTDIYLQYGDPINTTTFTLPLALTADTETGEQNLTFDLVEGLNSGGGSSDYLVQGGWVYERNNSLYAIMITGGSTTSFNFSAPLSVVATAQLPSLAVQSVFRGGNGYVGHLAYRSTSSGSPQVQYTQFAISGGAIVQETQSSLPAATTISYPSVTVEPYLATELTGTNFVTARFDKDVTVSYADQSSKSLNAARNSGGIGATIASALGIANNVPLSPFTDTGFATLAPSILFSFGPKTVATTRINTTDYVRVGGVLDNNVVLVQELGSPTPTATATPTVSVSPSVSPVASATASVSPSPSSTAGLTLTATPSLSPTSVTTVTPSLSPTATPIIFPTASLTASPTASASATPSPFTTASPSPSPTVGATFTPLPNDVTQLEIIDKLLGFPPVQTAQRVAQHDSDGNGFWDAADVASFNAAKR
ncbi:MAG: hypothetical protein ABI579_00325 [Candidatus Sumerlaeota bacterium]